MNIQGRIESIGNAVSGISGAGKEWSKTTVVINTEQGEYPDRLAIDFYNKPDDVKKLVIGNVVKIEYNTKVTESNGRYYNNINAWKFEIMQANF